MGKTTKWQSSWDNEADENGDLFWDYLIKQDEEYVIVVLRTIIHQLAGKDFGEVKLSFLGDDGECPSSVVDRKNLKMR